MIMNRFLISFLNAEPRTLALNMPTTPHIETLKTLAARLARPVRMMEVCGTHTMTAFRSGLRFAAAEQHQPAFGTGLPGLRHAHRFH